MFLSKTRTEDTRDFIIFDQNSVLGEREKWHKVIECLLLHLSFSTLLKVKFAWNPLLFPV